jgi:hypothetical protein
MDTPRNTNAIVRLVITSLNSVTPVRPSPGYKPLVINRIRTDINIIQNMGINVAKTTSPPIFGINNFRIIKGMKNAADSVRISEIIRIEDEKNGL